MKKILCAAALAFSLQLVIIPIRITEPDTRIATPDAPKSVGYAILKTYPHDTSSFTQGLILYKGGLYEGTGEYGRSIYLKLG